MKFLASAVLALVLVPLETALGQELGWEKLTQLSPGSKVEVVDAQSVTIQGQLVSIDEQGLTIRRKGSGPGVTETIAREDVVSVTVKRPSMKKIALLAAGGSALGALAGGSRCRGGTEYVGGYPYGSTVCRDPHGFYFDKTGGAIGAGAGAALGLLGLAFPEKRLLYRRSFLAKANDLSSQAGVDSGAEKTSPLQFDGEPKASGVKFNAAAPAITGSRTERPVKGASYAAQD